MNKDEWKAIWAFHSFFICTLFVSVNDKLL